MTTTVLGKRYAFAAAAESFIGAPFRLHGTTAEGGLDCVGLVEAALKTIGSHSAKPNYGLRNAAYDFVPHYAALNGFGKVGGKFQCGDLIAVKPGPAQLHLLIATSARKFVHAHAGLRRVVQTTAPVKWPQLHHFRLHEEE